MTLTTEIHWCRISQAGVLNFDGSDTPAFLQGQLTNNVAAVDNAHSQYSGYCTPKGRLLAVMLLWRRDTGYYAMLPRDLCEPMRKRLSLYILRAKVKATDVSDTYALYCIHGDGAAAVLAALGLSAPDAVNAVSHDADASVIKLPLDRYLIAAHGPEAARIEAALLDAAPASPETLWTALDIEAGIPSVIPATQEQFVPQSVNFDLIGAVSFDKGCYPGQEIVARTHYLGKVKQRMVRAHVQTPESPAAGDKLYSTAFGDQASGMIVSTVATPTGGHDLLAVVQSGSIEADDVHWQSVDGPALKLAPLPYLIR